MSRLYVNVPYKDYDGISFPNFSLSCYYESLVRYDVEVCKYSFGLKLSFHFGP